MSYSLELYFNYSCAVEFSDLLGIKLGVELADTASSTRSFSREFVFSGTQFYLSRNDVDLSGSGISDDVYQLRLESEIPHPSELGAFSNVYAVIIKTIHADMQVDQSLLCFSSQSSIAKFTSRGGALVDELGRDRISFDVFPKVLEVWLLAELAKLHPCHPQLNSKASSEPAGDMNK